MACPRPEQSPPIARVTFRLGRVARDRCDQLSADGSDIAQHAYAARCIRSGGSTLSTTPRSSKERPARGRPKWGNRRDGGIPATKTFVSGICRDIRPLWSAGHVRPISSDADEATGRPNCAHRIVSTRSRSTALRLPTPIDQRGVFRFQGDFLPPDPTSIAAILLNSFSLSSCKNWAA